MRSVLIEQVYFARKAICSREPDRVYVYEGELAFSYGSLILTERCHEADAIYEAARV